MKGRCLFRVTVPAVVMLCWTGCSWLNEESKNAAIEREKIVKPEDRERWQNEAAGEPVKAPEEMAVEQVDQQLYTPPTPAPTLPVLPSTTGKAPDFQELLAGQRPPEMKGDEEVVADFNFKDAGMKDVVTVFADLLKFAFVIEGDLPNTATMSMHEKVTQAQLWDVFMQLLRATGVAASFEGGVLHLRNQRAVANELTLDALSDHVELGVFHLKNSSAAEILERIKGFMQRDVRAVVRRESNTLLLLDTRDNIAKLKVLIAELDRPVTVNLARAVYPCRTVKPSQIAKELRTVLPILGLPVAEGNNARAGLGGIALTAVDRLDFLLASAPSAEVLKEVGRWVETFDQAEYDQEQIYLYECVHSRAEVMARGLATMFTVTGTMLSSDNTGRISEVANINTSPSLAPNPEVAPGTVFDIPVRIWVDNLQNRLSIRTKPRVYAAIKAYLDRIDTIPAQVLLRVQVLELNLTDSVNFGIEFSTSTEFGNWNSVAGDEYKYLTPGVGQGTQYGGKWWIYDQDNPNEKFAYVNALAGQNNVRTISSPQVLVCNHYQAQVKVGDQVPIITSEVTNTSSSTATGTNLVRSVTYKDTGVMLDVTPVITRGGRISLRVKQDVSEAQTNTTSTIDSPQVQNRTVTTMMTLRDGQTIVCGGLIREKLVDTLDSLPVISSIPFLRRLLGNTAINTTRTEMLVMITATIVSDETPLQRLVRGYQQAVDSLIEFEQNADTKTRLRRFKHNGDLDRWFLE